MTLSWKNWIITAAAGLLVAMAVGMLAGSVAFAQENAAPVAADDATETPANTAVVIAVLANDTDADEGDELSVTNLGAPANGAAVLNEDGTVTYTPAEDFVGEDSFSYTANDGVADSNQTVVTVTVTEAAEEDEADEDTASGTRKGFVGALQGDLENGLTLVLKGTGEEVTLAVPEDFANIKTPGGPRASELGDGSEVVVLAERDADGNWTVKMVVVKPSKPPKPVNGVVTEVNEDGTFTITTPNGKSHTIRRGGDDDEPVEGEVLTLFPDEDLPEDGDEGDADPPTVRGLVKAAEVRARLKKHLDDANNDADGDEGGDENDPSAQGRARRAAALADLLANHDDRRVTTLDAAIERAGNDTAKAAIERAKTRAQDARANAEDAKQRARDRAAARGGNRPEGTGQGANGRPDDTGQGNTGRPEGTGQGASGRPEGTGQGNTGRPANAGRGNGNNN